MRYFEGFPEYVPVGVRAAQNEQKLIKYQAKYPQAEPIMPSGGKLGNTWWGKAWNKNLESYADFSNRLARGKSYLKTGAIYDLQIAEGQINAVVQGSESAPYKIVITIEPLSAAKWQRIVWACEGRIESLQQLINGDFPKDLGEVLLQKGDGLFPNPKEMQLSCSCPDLARMCKHVAAALYGVGVKLDGNPQLFFMLRQVAMDDLIAKALGDNVEALLAKADQSSRRVISDDNIEDLFGL